jgi:hypothetical protein
LRFHSQIKLIAVLSIILYACHVDATDERYCNVDEMKKIVLDSCSYLVDHVEKRETDLSDFGFNVERVKGENQMAID